MHRVLFIREILLDIFSVYLPATPLEFGRRQPDLVALARTCQTFKEPALDVLWKVLSDLSPLARCLPEACGFDRWQRYSFRRPLSTAEWKTLRGYTRRVRLIYHYHGRRDDMILHFLAPFTDPLFPNLQSLYWGYLKTLPVAHIAVPSLTSLHINHLPGSHSPVSTEILDTIGERCPNIRSFLAPFPTSGPSDASISRQLCRWSNLQYANCRGVTLTMDVILHLPSLPILKRLLCTLSADLSNHTTHLGSVFVLSNLADLYIKSTSLKSITTFFSRIQLPKIENLRVSVSEYTPRLDVQEYWTTVQGACPCNTLARLVFSSIFDDSIMPDLNEQGRPSLTLHDLLPYKDFGNLHKIEIDVPWSVDLTDTDLLDLVSTSPRLQELCINNYWGWRMNANGGITLSGLVQLLRQCPFLCVASLVIDSRTFTQTPPGLDVLFLPWKMLFLNYLDSDLVPEFTSDSRSVFKALKMSVGTSIPQ